MTDGFHASRALPVRDLAPPARWLRPAVAVRRALDVLPTPVVVAALVAVAAAAALACGVVVAEVVEDLMDGGRAGQPDRSIMAWVRELRTPPLTTFFRTVTHLGDSRVAAVVVVLVAAVLLRRRRPALAVAVAASSVGASLVTGLLKGLIGRDRPPALSRLIEVTGHALPSGHSSQAVACYGAIAVVVAVMATRRVARIAAPLAAAVVALLVGASRVYLGVHWASDVVIGWSVGLAWLLAVSAVCWMLWRIDRPAGWWSGRHRAPAGRAGPTPGAELRSGGGGPRWWSRRTFRASRAARHREPGAGDSGSRRHLAPARRRVAAHRIGVARRPAATGPRRRLDRPGLPRRSLG